ncbi:fumarylacetoacetate hydrolase family protein [Zobellia uliginosa]|uniref:fumarylacetoacetate hydrolase family protein n=1 Tax=Zobellia uliginosa TaxID=143224 RepID=UPI0026E36C39|nr:fumarylacetoacetate hydrolase family protein [Zobellia uliginosa]MDO6517414.1 fumarylacetoacetate hydrolase family protein [Zobellia uliginosa]
MNYIDLNRLIPELAETGTWIGRCMVPAQKAYNGIAGPHVVMARKGKIYDLSAHFNSTSELFNCKNPVSRLKALSDLPELGSLKDALKNALYFNQNPLLPYIIAPNDIQAIKACGVTFIKSLLERVIEEKAKGDALVANDIRQTIYDTLGNDLSKVTPGSPETEKLKEELQKKGLWSQYLEVGIGKDAEVFTKAQPLSAVGFGAEIGVLKSSKWNNPEPEIVLAVSSSGKIVGATLGNDVNLRDYEGRSALLLGEAKDQNGSCAIGPLFRLFDETFSLDDVKDCDVMFSMKGKDNFATSGSNKMKEISRSPENLVAQVIGKNHQYPDGLVLFLGTMFAPTEDRNGKGLGFTHKKGDQVNISSSHLGTLINWVNTCDQIPKWEFGIGAFTNYIVKRNLK